MQRSNAPVGKRLDEQLALTYEKVRRNGSMGMQSLEFVASHFNISHDAVHRVCRRYHQEEMQAPSFALTFPQFTRIMRETLGKTGGGDLQHGTVDQARGLARSFTIYDATATTPGRLRTANLRLARKPIKEVEDTSWGPVGDDGGSRGFTPLDTGLATPRRLKTASFLPPTLNLTWSARRPNLCEGARDSHFLFANVPRNVKSSHSKLLSNMWQSEYMDLGKFYSEETDFSTAGEYVPASKFHEHTKFETEANEIGRANRRLKTGHLLEPPVRHPADPRAWGKLGEDHRPVKTGAGFMVPTAAESVIFRTRQTIVDRGWTRFDVAAPFTHYDCHGTGLISVAHAMAAMAELGEKVSEETMKNVLVAVNALLEQDHAMYDVLVDALVDSRNDVLPEDEIYFEAEDGEDGAPSKAKNWPEDLMKALQILHSKVANKTIPSVPFMAEIIANDGSLSGKVDAAVFSRIVAKIGITKDHVSLLLREFKVDKNKVNYRDLIKALEDYPAEATRQSMVYPRNRKYLSNKKRRSSVEGGPKVDDFKDPSQRNRAAIEAIHAKISRKIVNAGDLRLAFEKYDISRRGRITYDFFMMALGQFGLVFEEAEAKQLLIVMDPKGEKSIEYGRFISMVFPPSNMQTARKGPMSFKASLRAMSNMSPADQLRHLQMCVEKALSKGPRELQRMLGIFRLSGDEDINISSLKVMLMDFGLSLTDAQTLALMRQVDPSTKGRISYFKLISGLLPSDCVLEQGMRSGLAVGSTMLHRHRPSQNKLSDADFHHAMLARIKRQLYRKGPSGVPVGHQLRDVLSGLLCRNDVGMQDLRRAFVGVGILMDDSDIERLVNLYRSPAHPSMRLSQLIEDIDDKTFDFVFSTGNVAGSGLQRIQKELPAPNEPDALIRNKLRRVLRRRLEQDGSKSIVTVLRLHDLDRTGRLTCAQLQAALFNLGLKVESYGNMQRLWTALAKGLGTNGEASSLDLLALADTLNRGAERVTRPVPDDSPRPELYLG